MLALTALAAGNSQAAYSITTLGSAVTENFTGFTGGGAPANWTVTGQSAWRGFNNGSSVVPGTGEGGGQGTVNQNGAWSFGNGSDGSLGFLASASATTSATAAASFQNNTGGVINELIISYDGEQWRNGSRPSSFTVEISIDGGPYTAISALAYVAPNLTGGTNGTAGSGAGTNKSATLTGLNITEGQSFDIRWTYSGNGDGSGSGSRAGISIDNLSVTANGVPSGPNTSEITTPPAVAFGRVIKDQAASQNVALGKTGTGDAEFTTSTSGAATTTTAEGTVTASGGSVNVGLDTSATGDQSGTVTLTNESTTLPENTTDIDVSGTVVDNRTITATGVSLGKVLVGYSATTTLTTTGDDDHYTRVTVPGGEVTDNGVTLSGSSAVFDDAADTSELTVTFTTSGAKTGTASLTAGNGGVTGEGLAGESVKDITVSVEADVYQSGQVFAYADANGGPTHIGTGVQTTGTETINEGEPLEAGQSIRIENGGSDDGGQRSDIVVAGVEGTPGFSLSGDIGNGATIASGFSNSKTGQVNFDSNGKLNGTHVGSIVVGLQNDQSIAGTFAGDLGAYIWRVTATVAGNTGNGTAHVLAGGSYAGFSTVNGSGLGTGVALLGGAASVARDISISLDSTAPAAFAAGNDAFRVSDIVNLEGSGGDLIVLQLSYDEAALLLAGLSEEDARLMWFNGSNWVLAVNGNSDGGASGQFFSGAYAGQTTLGAHGLDMASNTVWAVIDHNSEFAALAAPVPEPGTLGLLMGAGVLAAAMRRRRANG